MITTLHRLTVLALAVALTCAHAINSHAKDAGTGADPEPVILLDFEGQDAADDWRVVNGRLEWECGEVPSPPPTGPEGHGLRIRNAKSATLMTRHGVLRTDWSGYGALSFWVYRSPGSVQQTPTTIMRVKAWELDGHAAFIRRVDLSGEGWTEVTVPLRWFRWKGGRVPRWSRVDGVAFEFETPGEHWLDEISLIPAADPGGHPYPSLAELAELAEGFDAEVQVTEQDGIALISAAPELDTEQLLAHLAEVRAAVMADMPFLAPPARPISLVVLPDDASFQAYVDRLADAHAANADVPGLPGFTLMGVATSFWDPEHGTLRPVYTHEFVHALMCAAVGLPNLTEWFQEGMASRYQWRFHPESLDADFILSRMDAPDGHRTLPSPCHGKRIDLDDYWQAMTVVDVLVDHERYAPHLEMLLHGFRDAGSTDLRPHVGTVLGVTWDELEQDWREDVARRYGASD